MKIYDSVLSTKEICWIGQILVAWYAVVIVKMENVNEEYNVVRPRKHDKIDYS